MSVPLFPPAFFHALAGLVRRRRLGPGRAAAPRAGRGRRGFEHRPWSPGDDLRLLDWRATARFDRPLVRLREEERGGRLRLVLDRSASLAPGSARRDRDQRRLALALGWLHLESGGVLELVVGGTPGRLLAGFERRAEFQSLLASLPAPAGNDRVAAGGEAAVRPGPTVWLTDPWSGLPGALGPRKRVAELILAEEDRPPAGGLLLRAAEAEEGFEVDLRPERWARRWEAWLAERWARIRAAGAEAVPVRCPTEEDPVGLLLRAEEAGLV
ncbi:MAG: DUF58 domain-containing protein [Planctomycetota bacterium]|nr:MAG: DUF58 domain-containing protein [Planctomycetota bacterium]